MSIYNFISIILIYNFVSIYNLFYSILFYLPSIEGLISIPIHECPSSVNASPLKPIYFINSNKKEIQF